MGLLNEGKRGRCKFIAKFCEIVKTQFGRDVKIIRSYNGLDFHSRPMIARKYMGVVL